MPVSNFFHESSTSYAAFEEGPSIVRLWILRILVKLGGHRNFLYDHGWSHDELAHYLDIYELEELVEDDRKTFQKAALAKLKELHVEAEKQKKSSKMGLPEALEKNVQRLADHLGLSTLDKKIITFTVTIYNESVLEAAADQMGDLNVTGIFSCLAVLLDSDVKSIRDAFSTKGKLCSSGIVSLNYGRGRDLKSRLDIFSCEFSNRMAEAEQDPIDLIRDRVRPSKTATLTLKDYSHQEKNVTLLQFYLQESLKTKRTGVNILIYGPPGTGKSELARFMAKSCQVALYEIASEDNDGNPIDGEARLSAYRAAMSFFASHPTLLLFDEVEDIYHDGGFFNRSTAEKHKGWLNRMLEENPIPTLWLSNSAHIDPAFVRRYDMTFKLDVAPERRRKEILQKIAGEYLTEADLKAASRSADLAPAIVSRAASVIKAIQHDLPETEWSSSLMHLMNNTLETQGHARVKTNATDLPVYYNPAFINTPADLTAIAHSLREVADARLCLYGPPGTGKTAYGRWLAETLDKPLLVKRASDLQSMWVGETEKNIAQTFSEAENDGAILMIDEVENFLSDRRQAQHRWETSQVNEMLTQMESFNGIFVASTNLMDGLDQAAFRRFDIKLKFDYLQPEQAWELLCLQCLSLGIEAPSATDKAHLHELRVLTPGDFAVVARRHRFSKYRQATEVIAQLKQEIEIKEDAKIRRPIGFIH